MNYGSLEVAGITVVKGGVERSTCESIALECEELLFSHLAIDFDRGNPTEAGPPIWQRQYRLSIIKGSGLVSINCVLGLHPYPQSPDATVIVNGQEPGAVQNFHSDIVQGSQVIVQASSGGAFDYYPNFDPLNPDDFDSLDVGIGDIIMCNRSFIRHRGRNPSDQTRYNLVFTSGLAIE